MLDEGSSADIFSHKIYLAQNRPVHRAENAQKNGEDTQ